MAHHALERRESVVRRMLRKEMSISALARESGIAEATLYRWRDQATTNGEAVNTPKQSEKHPPARKFAIVAESVSFNEAELAECCRKQGLYPEHVKAWRQTCEQALAGGMVPAKALREAKATDRKRIQELERELRRKDKALAETAALLILRKKAAAIWGFRCGRMIGTRDSSRRLCADQRSRRERESPAPGLRRAGVHPAHVRALGD